MGRGCRWLFKPTEIHRFSFCVAWFGRYPVSAGCRRAETSRGPLPRCRVRVHRYSALSRCRMERIPASSHNECHTQDTQPHPKRPRLCHRLRHSGGFQRACSRPRGRQLAADSISIFLVLLRSGHCFRGVANPQCKRLTLQNLSYVLETRWLALLKVEEVAPCQPYSDCRDRVCLYLIKDASSDEGVRKTGGALNPAVALARLSEGFKEFQSSALTAAASPEEQSSMNAAANVE